MDDKKALMIRNARASREYAYYMTREVEDESRSFASLKGPLSGVFYPLPFAEREANLVTLQGSDLKDLWCDIYTLQEVREMTPQPVILPYTISRRLTPDLVGLERKFKKAFLAAQPQADAKKARTP